MIENSIFTFNEQYCLNVLKPAFEAKINKQVCFHFQKQESYTYPGVLVRHMVKGDYDESAHEHFNLIEFTIMTNDNNEQEITKLIEEFYKVTKLKRSRRNTNYTNIRLFDYTDENNPVEIKKCMRLKCNGGFISRDERNDYQICVSQILLTTNYT